MKETSEILRDAVAELESKEWCKGKLHEYGAEATSNPAEIQYTAHCMMGSIEAVTDTWIAYDSTGQALDDWISKNILDASQLQQAALIVTRPTVYANDCYAESKEDVLGWMRKAAYDLEESQ